LSTQISEEVIARHADLGLWIARRLPLAYISIPAEGTGNDST